MKFRYINDEPAEPMEMYGLVWSYGTVHEVEDTAFVAKLQGNRFFEVVGGEEPRKTAEPVKNKGGRPRKIVEVEAEDDGSNGTRAELATNVMRDLGLIAAEDSPSAADQAYVIARYEDALAEIADDNMVYWDDDAIPLIIFDPLTKLIGLTVGTAFGVPSLAENLHQARDMFLRRIRRHTGKKSAGQSVYVDDY